MCESDSVFNDSGNFNWDESGNVVVLDGTEDAPNRYKVVEGAVIQLDMDGNQITGDLALNYRLDKAGDIGGIQSDMNDLKDVPDKKFLLVELMGKPYSAANTDKAVYIQFDSSEGRASGHSGCNSFSGSYQLESGNRIRFSQMVSTMMACADMTIEQELLQVIEIADNYNFDGTNLILNKARMAPLARFVIES